MHATSVRDSASRLWPLFACSLALAGCGGGGGSFVRNPISVYLPIATVELFPGASPVTIPIQIASPSETALVSVSGLPPGIQEKYASTDTNPSGTLTFGANGTAMTGTFTPTITVMSSGLTASTGLTLIVK